MPTYTVTFPDGHAQDFTGPAGMSDIDAFNRATQERAFAEGKIPTTWLGGAAKTLGEDKATTSALIGGAGMLTGVAPVVAAAPLAAEGLKYATQKMTGQKPATPSVADLATDVGSGVAAAYGPALVAKSSKVIASAVKALPGTTVPQAAVKAGVEIAAPLAADAGKITPSAVGATVTELTEAVKQLGTRMNAGLSQDEVGLMRDSIAKGMRPSTAAKIVSGGNPSKFSALMKLYLRPSVGLVK